MIVKKIILIIILSILLSDCPDGHYEYYENECYHMDDIDFLNELIDNHCSDYDGNGYYTVAECVFAPNSNMIIDYNENGIVQPLEICIQDWYDYDYSSNSSFRLNYIDCSFADDNLI